MVTASIFLMFFVILHVLCHNWGNCRIPKNNLAWPNKHGNTITDMQKYTEYFQQYWVCSLLKTRIYLDYPGRQSQAACNFLPRKSSESLHQFLDKLNCNKQLPQRIRNTITISPSSSSLTMIVIYIYILVKLMTIMIISISSNSCLAISSSSQVCHGHGWPPAIPGLLRWRRWGSPCRRGLEDPPEPVEAWKTFGMELGLE